MADITVGEPNGAEYIAKQAVRNAIPAYQAAMDDLTDNWAGLTTAQKSEALRTALIICMRVIRWIVIRDLKL